MAASPLFILNVLNVKRLTYGGEEWTRCQEVKKIVSDYIKRFLIAVIMGCCVSLLFLGGKQTDTGMQDVKEVKYTFLE